MITRYALWMRASGRAERTIENRVDAVELFGRRTGADVVHCDWLPVAEFLANVPTPGTRWNYHQSLNSWFQWLIRMEVRPDNPLDHIERPKRGRAHVQPYEDAALARVLAAGMYRRTRMKILLGALEGMRCMEIAKMDGAQLDGQWLTIVGKGGAQRVVPVHPVVAQYAETQGFPERGLWFPSPDDPSRPVSARSVSSVVGKAVRRAGIPTGGAHRLRHWYATTNLANGGNLAEVQDLLGHADPNTTRIYTRVRQSQLADLVDRLELPAHVPTSRSQRERRVA